MAIPIRFKPKDKIRRIYNGRELIVFYPGCEYHGEMEGDGTIYSDSSKYDGTFKLKRKEVIILEYL